MSRLVHLAVCFVLVVCIPTWISFDVYSLVALVFLAWFVRELAMVVWPRLDPAPTLRYKDSTLTRFVLKRVPRLHCGFRPPLHARGGHMQTITWLLSGKLRVDKAELRVKRQLLQMKDRGLVALDWLVNDEEHAKDSRPIVLIVPAIHQSSLHLSAYAELAHSTGMKSVVFQRRGHDGCPMTVPRLQSFGDPSDLRQVVRYLRTQFPNTKLAAIGVSSGASLLLSYLGEFGSSAHLSASAVISPLWDPYHVYKTENGHHVLFTVSTILSVKRLIARNKQWLTESMNVDDVLRNCWNLTELERSTFAVPNGFEDLDTYWERNSPIREVDEVAAPVLALNAKDDPFYSPQWVPYDLASHYPNFFLVTTERGGHAAFMDADANDESWAVKTAVEYLAAVIEFESSPNN